MVSTIEDEPRQCGQGKRVMSAAEINMRRNIARSNVKWFVCFSTVTAFAALGAIRFVATLIHLALG